MRNCLFILAVALISNAIEAQYVYRGRIISVVRQQPIRFGTVSLPSPPRSGRHGKELAKIDSLGYFTFTLKDTSNVRIIVDCSLSGSAVQRISYSESLTIIFIKTDCYDYNIDRAKGDIANNDIYLLCYFGYVKYKFTAADTAFERKYGIRYQTFADTPIWSDCMWLYNKTIAEYLDKKFGDSWRKEVRWDVDFY